MCASFFAIGETTCPEMVLFTDAGCIWTDEISAEVGVRQGVATEAVCVTDDSVRVDNVLVETCSVECGSELENCRIVAMRSIVASVLRRVPTFTHYS